MSYPEEYTDEVSQVWAVLTQNTRGLGGLSPYLELVRQWVECSWGVEANEELSGYLDKQLFELWPEEVKEALKRDPLYGVVRPSHLLVNLCQGVCSMNVRDPASGLWNIVPLVTPEAAVAFMPFWEFSGLKSLVAPED